MTKFVNCLLLSIRSLAAVAAMVMVAGVARAQCPVTEVTSGLDFPLGITLSNQNNLIVGESGTSDPNTGRISLVDLDGNRRTLLEGLPSGINDVGEPSGPAGVYLRGRTLYVLIGIGDVLVAGPAPGTAAPNPNPLSSPLFSSVLAVHFSAHAEKSTDGFTLSLADQEALADGERVTLSNGGGEKVTIELVADFPNFIPDPLPFFAGNVRGSNPFDLVAVANRLFVTDGGRNLVWEVDIHSGAVSQLVAFPPIDNPLPFGPPVIEAVPTGIVSSGGQLLVTLFRGFPFPAGASDVVQVDPVTGSQTLFIDGLSSGIDVLPIRTGADIDYLVLEFSADMLAGELGRLLRFETPESSPTVLADCLIAPTSMTLDEKTGTLYVTSLTGSIVAIPIAP